MSPSSSDLSALDVNTRLYLNNLIRRMELSTYSTAFSGVDSPGTAFAQLRAATSAVMGKQISHPQHLHAVVT